MTLRSAEICNNDPSADHSFPTPTLLCWFPLCCSLRRRVPVNFHRGVAWMTTRQTRGQVQFPPVRPPFRSVIRKREGKVGLLFCLEVEQEAAAHPEGALRIAGLRALGISLQPFQSEMLPVPLAVTVLKGRKASRNVALAAEEEGLFVQAHHTRTPPLF